MDFMPEGVGVALFDQLLEYNLLLVNLALIQAFVINYREHSGCEIAGFLR